ncbi:hypothetical protein BH11PSE11_BH11PSE11_07690 [soil metagenome]
MQRFKDVLVAKGSELAEALAKDDRKLAEKVYAETSERYKRLYPAEDRKWFESFMPV